MSPGSRALFPLGHPQLRTLYSELLYPGTGVGNLAGSLSFPGTARDLERLAAAVTLVVAGHDALHLRLTPASAMVGEQYLAPRGPLDLAEIDGDDQAALAAASQEPFSLWESPLFLFRLLRFADERIGLFFKYHHAIVDAWTVSLLNRQFHERFRALAEHGAAVPVAEHPSFLEFLQRERDYLASPEREQDEVFFRESLVELPGAADASPSGIATWRFTHELDPALTAALEGFCQSRGTTVFRFFLAVLARHFTTDGEHPDVVIGTGHHNRLTPREKAMAGMTVSTVPLCLRVDPRQSFVDLLGDVHARSTAALARQRFPFDLLAPAVRRAGRDPVQLLRYFLNHIPSFDGPYTVARYSPGADLSELDVKINPNQRPRGTPLQLCVDARRSLHDEQRVRQLFAQVERLVRESLADPERVLAPVAVHPAPDSSRSVLHGPPAWRPDGVGTFLEAFARTAATAAPGSIAVVDAHTTLTYEELARRVHAAASGLAVAGIGPGATVAVVTTRTVDFLVAALAVMRAGAAYVPLEPDLPEQRRTELLGSTRAALVLTSGLPAPPGEPLPWRLLDEVAATGASSLPDPPGPDDTAYVITTSGTTGEPKGVMIPHRALWNLLCGVVGLGGLTAADRASAYCSFMFDVSVAELFAPLVVGASVHIVPEGLRHAVSDLDDFFEQHRISVATLPTRVGELFQEHARGATLRLLTVAGEQLRVARPRGYRLVNAYGPTEATVYATAYEVPGEGRDLPIGVPLPGMTAFVVDDQGQLVPRGEPGELWLAGAGIATGYLGREEETRRVFVPNPFATGPHEAIAYRTGDRARVLPDGNLAFLGRRDRQIKLRGFRIELEEIERCLGRCPGVERGLVVVRSRGADEQLWAFCTASGPVDEAALQDLLRAELPGYAVPARCLVVPAFPLDRHGKIDQGRLVEAAGGQVVVAPRDAAEAALLELFREVLGRDDFGVTDSFFALGGDSLAAMRLFAALARRGRGRQAVSLLFAAPTVAQLSRALSEAEGSPAGRDDLVTTLAAGSGAGPVLCCVHDFTTDLLSYASLLAHLDPGVTVLGLRWSPRLGASVASLEELAARYVQALRTVLPAGPYHLLGYSFGGTIAYELARQLAAQGCRVGLLALIDTPNFARDARFLERFVLSATKSVLLWLRGMSFSAKLAFLEGSFGARPRLGRVRALLAAQGQMRRLALAYRPGPVPWALVLFRSRERRVALDATLGWRELVPAVEVCDVSGNHITVMSEQHVPQVARRLGELLTSTAVSPDRPGIVHVR
ncbi:MAG: amino acid adenylation domain-containing protein [Myxococcota bacterium]|nr:amino acid adenylation domain-containing protein [Myxococcota bacterium]